MRVERTFSTVTFLYFSRSKDFFLCHRKVVHHFSRYPWRKKRVAFNTRTFIWESQRVAKKSKKKRRRQKCPLTVDTCNLFYFWSTRSSKWGMWYLAWLKNNHTRRQASLLWGVHLNLKFWQEGDVKVPSKRWRNSCVKAMNLINRHWMPRYRLREAWILLLDLREKH